MKETVRLEIISTDRIGMTHDLLEVFYRHSVNIVALEVFPNKMLIKFEVISQEHLERLRVDLENYKGVDTVKMIYLLNHEINERKLKGTIESIQKGIITVNDDGEIEVFNEAALSYFNLRREEISNRQFDDFFQGDESFLKLYIT